MTIKDIEGMNVEEMAQTAEDLVEQIRTLQALAAEVAKSREGRSPDGHDIGHDKRGPHEH